MAAPGIPNLATLRKGARGSARGGGLASRASHVDKDRVIRATDNDASTSRVSAVEAGYLEDPFAKYLCAENWQRRLPLMNRGTYIRTTAIDKIVDTFLSSPLPQPISSNESADATPRADERAQWSRKQIVSLGAGSDTRYFRLRRDKRHTDFTYHELDFAENNRAKIDRLRKPECVELIKRECDVDLNAAETDGNGCELQTKDYSIHASDLRALPESLPWLDPGVPTLLVSECCLIYLSPDAADNVLKYFSDRIVTAPLAIVIYEPFRPYDAFGQTMIRNLMGRGIVLQTIEKYSDLQKQKCRMGDLGMEAQAMDCEEIWRQWVSPDEKERIDKLEWMDEVEEFVLLAKHYCVAWGWRELVNDDAWMALSASS